MNVRKLLGKRIKELRISCGLKQAELAEIIGIEPRSISRIESGFHFPKDEHLEKFANAFKVELKDLFDFSHLESVDYIPKIMYLLKSANDDSLKTIYKIVTAMFK